MREDIRPHRNNLDEIAKQTLTSLQKKVGKISGPISKSDIKEKKRYAA